MKKVDDKLLEMLLYQTGISSDNAGVRVKNNSIVDLSLGDLVLSLYLKIINCLLYICRQTFDVLSGPA
jgi:hypothetical protein